MKYGYDKLLMQTVDVVLSRLSLFEGVWSQELGKAESEIERLMIASIIMTSHYAYDMRVRFHLDGLIENDLNPEIDLLIAPQVEIGKINNWRVDFLMLAPAETHWRKLIVECDGHDFHERTKEQAARDRSRDRAAQSNGYEIFRFTGSEIWRDPMGCANQVLKWARS